MIRYQRAPSPALQPLLIPGGFLAPLLAPRQVAVLPLDVHLREKNRVHLYCGLTRLVDVTLGSKFVRLTASTTYAQQDCTRELFRVWRVGEPGFDAALDAYLSLVRVGTRFTEREGRVQAAWSAVRTPWIQLDREAVLGYDKVAGRVDGRRHDEVVAARRAVVQIASAHGWAPLPEKSATELDQLAVDPHGRLVLLELKDASAGSASVYYAPLQLLQYVHEWAASLESVRPGLNALRDARVAIGLSPVELPRPTAGLRPAIGFGADSRSAEVRARFDTVLRIANSHLPPGVKEIEVWSIHERRAVRIR